MSKKYPYQIIQDHSLIIITALEDYREWWSEGNASEGEVIRQIDEAIEAINNLSDVFDDIVAVEKPVDTAPPYYTHPDSNAFISWD